MYLPTFRSKIIFTAALAAATILVLIGAAQYDQYLSTQLVRKTTQQVDTFSSGEPAILTGQVLVRMTNEQARALRTALAALEPPVEVEPSPSPTPIEGAPSPTPSATPSLAPSPESTTTVTPTPTSSTAATPKQNIRQPNRRPLRDQLKTAVGLAPHGQTRLEAALAAVPQLSVLGDNLNDIEPVIPLPGISDQLHAIDRWFLLTLPGEQRTVQVRNIESLEPIGEPVEPAPPLGGFSDIDDLISQDPYSSETILRREASLERRSVPPEDTVAAEQTKTALGNLAQAGFEKVEPVGVIELLNTPNDPFYHSSGSWGQDYDDLWGLKKIEAEGAWDVTTGSSDTVIAVVDTGLDFTHQDIQENVWANPGEIGIDSNGQDKRSNGLDDDDNGYPDDWRGWDFSDNDNNPTDDNGHGTHVAGTIAAKGDNGAEIVGVMWEAQIMPLKIFPSRSILGEDFEAAAAIRYAADNGAKVMNNSWGGPGFSILTDAVQYAHYEKGVLLVAAAGNSGDNFIRWPARYAEVLTVGASTQNDERAIFSSFGREIDVVGPGGGHQDAPLCPGSPNSKFYNILSLRAAEPETNECLSIGGSLWRLAGTSMASPHVTGLAGLILSLHPDWSPDEVRNTIRATADDVEEPGYDIETGWGRINAGRALAVPAPFPRVEITSPTSALITSTGGEEGITIRGVAAGPSFSSFRVEMGQGPDPISWTTEGITLVGSGNQPIENDVLAQWDTSGVTASGRYTLRLVVRTTFGEETSFQVPVLADLTVRTGWPTNPVADLPVDTLLAYNMALGNVDADDEKEIIISAVNEPSPSSPFPSRDKQITISAYNPDGSVVAGWPLRMDGLVASAPILADLDGDGRDEIFVSHVMTSAVPKTTLMHRYRGDGVEYPGWPIDLAQSNNGLPETMGASLPTIVDLDNNGSKEILLLATDSQSNDSRVAIYAWDVSGSMLANWPKFVPTLVEGGIAAAYPEQAIVAADVTGDGIAELFINIPMFDRSSIFALNSDGSPLAGWPVTLDPAAHGDLSLVLNTVAIGNIAGDATPEVVMSTNNIASCCAIAAYISAYQLDGTSVPGWPQSIPSNLGIYLGGSPTLIDLDGDSLKEIVIARYAWRGDGTIYPGWDADENVGYVFASNATVDITGDGIQETLSAQPGPLLAPSYYYLYGIQSNRTDAPDWPKPLLFPVVTHPLADDLDGDGTIEIVSGLINGQIIVHNTPGLASAGTWPQIHQDAQHRRGYTCYLPGDTNGDGAINIEDLNNVRNNFGKEGLGDTNFDGVVNVEDLNNVRNNFGKSC